MKILLTGATGYIGQHLLKKLLHEGHEVICCVRNPQRFVVPKGYEDKVRVEKVDFLDMDPDRRLDYEVDVAYYLIHSMSSSLKDFDQMEERAAANFGAFLSKFGTKQVIYLGGISNEKSLSKHLSSRCKVETVLRESGFPLTVLRAGIIVGAGSASFELIRDIVEKLPLMITPKWLHTKCQPISIDSVLEFLVGVILKEKYYDQVYDIGGEEILTYKEMLLQYAEVRGLIRRIFVIPLMTPRLSSYWLYFVTRVSYRLAVNLVDSMKVEVICRPNNLAKELGIEVKSYKKAVESALKIYGSGKVEASWMDALSSSFGDNDLEQHIEVPAYGCLIDAKEMPISDGNDRILQNIWSIGGTRGWYYGNWLWRIRGFIDKLFGGVGLRRGRTHENKLNAGDALDFWRVLVADRNSKRLLLFAEMKLPGEAWLEFKIEGEGKDAKLKQTATFRPKGLWGRAYWYMLLPFHIFLFHGMINRIVQFGRTQEEEAAAIPAL